jgi:hypothetical protein
MQQSDGLQELYKVGFFPFFRLYDSSTKKLYLDVFLGRIISYELIVNR